VWEFISSEEAVGIVSEVFQRGGTAAAASKKLVCEAKACWERDEGEYCDDITCVVIDLQTSVRRNGDAIVAASPPTVLGGASPNGGAPCGSNPPAPPHLAAS
jgi:hypothetical protein